MADETKDPLIEAAAGTLSQRPSYVTEATNYSAFRDRFGDEIENFTLVQVMDLALDALSEAEAQAKSAKHPALAEIRKLATGVRACIDYKLMKWNK